MYKTLSWTLRRSQDYDDSINNYDNNDDYDDDNDDNDVCVVKGFFNSVIMMNIDINV